MRALIYKELRESWVLPVAALAVVALLTLPDYYFVADDRVIAGTGPFFGYLITWAVGLLMGARMMSREEAGQRQFLSSLPLSGAAVVSVKLLVNLAVFLAFAVISFWLAHRPFALHGQEAFNEIIWFERNGIFGTFLATLGIFLFGSLASLLGRAQTDTVALGICAAGGADVVAVVVEGALIGWGYGPLWEAMLAENTFLETSPHEVLTTAAAASAMLIGIWIFDRIPILEQRKRLFRGLGAALLASLVVTIAAAHVLKATVGVG